MRNKVFTGVVIVVMIFSINTIAHGAINVPDGFEVKVFAKDVVRHPTSAAFDLNGRMFVSDNWRGMILLLEDTDDDGTADVVKTFATGFTYPIGIAVRHNKIYVSDNNPSEGTGKIVVLKDVDGDDVADVYNDIITGLPIGWHMINSLVFGPKDRKLYFPLGSTCNTCNETDPRSATILRADPDGSNLEIFARGLRNAFDLAFNGRGHLFATDNGREYLGDDEPLEELNHIVQGGDYGWPNCWDYNTQYGCEDKIPPIATFPAHSSADGVTFYPRKKKFPPEYRQNIFPPRYRRNLFVAEYGPNNPQLSRGKKVVRVRLRWRKRKGIYKTRVREFATGFVAPVDVLVGPKGGLFVVDLANTIYKISYVGTP